MGTPLRVSARSTFRPSNIGSKLPASIPVRGASKCVSLRETHSLAGAACWYGRHKLALSHWHDRAVSARGGY
jgi:hypothetical protein